jgi:transcriptional regulator with XRE-family HTH domain
MTKINLELYDWENIGEMVRKLRKERGMLQKQLAAKCFTTSVTISRLENPKDKGSRISYPVLERIMVELGATMKIAILKE